MTSDACRILGKMAAPLAGWLPGGLCALALSGCGGGGPTAADAMLSLRAGERCTVFFRHDALGMANEVPSGPTVGNFNGADLSVTGQFAQQNAEWVVLVDDQRELSIPKACILLIESRTNAK